MNDESEEALFESIEEELDTKYFKAYPSNWVEANKAFNFKGYELKEVKDE